MTTDNSISDTRAVGACVVYIHLYYLITAFSEFCVYVCIFLLILT